MVTPALGGRIEYCDLFGIAQAEACSLAIVVEILWSYMTPRTVC